MYRKWNRAGRRAAGEEQMGRRGWRRPKYNVPVNIIERDTEFEVRVHAVTFAKDQINISIVEDTLYISGQRTPVDDPSPNFVLQEYPIKSFERSFEMTDKIDRERIKARHEAGILVITCPKTQAAQRPEMRIDVE